MTQKCCSAVFVYWTFLSADIQKLAMSAMMTTCWVLLQAEAKAFFEWWRKGSDDPWHTGHSTTQESSCLETGRRELTGPGGALQRTDWTQNGSALSLLCTATCSLCVHFFVGLNRSFLVGFLLASTKPSKAGRYIPYDGTNGSAGTQLYHLLRSFKNWTSSDLN